MHCLLHKRADVSVYYRLEKLNYAKRNRVQFPFFPFGLIFTWSYILKSLNHGTSQIVCLLYALNFSFSMS
jgi:hypothetical protein